MEQILVFQIGPERLAFDAAKIHQVSEPIETVRVPGSPEYITGIVNFRGMVIPVIDLRKRLGLGPAADQSETMMIVAEENERRLGLVVDRVIGLRQIRAQAIEKTAQLLATKFDKEFFTGIVRLPECPVLLLDLKKLLTK
jgi:purine-binding chemotaxis protein CheW